MGPADLIRLALTASILLLVFVLGMRANVEHATYLFRQPARLLRGFLAMGVVVPVVVGVTVLLPLAVGLAVQRVVPLAAERVAPRVSRVGNVLLLAGLVAVLLFMAPAIVTLVGNGTILVIAAIVRTGLLAGHWLGGPDSDDRTALAIASSTRHPGVAPAWAAESQ